MKKCPVCAKKLKLKEAKCPGCGIGIHTKADCEGCPYSRGHECLAYVDKRDPILHREGRCLARATMPWMGEKQWKRVRM